MGLEIQERGRQSGAADLLTSSFCINDETSNPGTAGLVTGSPYNYQRRTSISGEKLRISRIRNYGSQMVFPGSIPGLGLGDYCPYVKCSPYDAGRASGDGVSSEAPVRENKMAKVINWVALLTAIIRGQAGLFDLGFQNRAARGLRNVRKRGAGQPGYLVTGLLAYAVREGWWSLPAAGEDLYHQPWFQLGLEYYWYSNPTGTPAIAYRHRGRTRWLTIGGDTLVVHTKAPKDVRVIMVGYSARHIADMLGSISRNEKVDTHPFPFDEGVLGDILDFVAAYAAKIREKEDATD